LLDYSREYKAPQGGGHRNGFTSRPTTRGETSKRRKEKGPTLAGEPFSFGTRRAGTEGLGVGLQCFGERRFNFLHADAAFR
jgi:hypothetical protein